MAHSIDTTTGKAAIFTGNGQKPWHGLGVTIEGQATSEQAIELAGLNWQVVQCPTFAMNGDQRIELASRANIRSDTGAVLGEVGSAYVPLQNSEAFAFMDQIVGEKSAAYDTAGALFGGRKVWMLAKLPNVIRTTRKDVTEGYLLLTNCHDGTESLRFFATTVRVVCNNTLTLALSRGDGSNGGGLFYRHTGDLTKRIEEARRYLGIAADGMKQVEDATKKLNKLKANDVMARSYFECLFPSDEGFTQQILTKYGEGATEQSRLVRLLLTGHEKMTDQMRNANAKIQDQLHTNWVNETAKGTAWGLYNAVSEWTDHQRSSKSQDRHFASVLTGRANQIKLDALDLAVALAV